MISMVPVDSGALNRSSVQMAIRPLKTLEHSNTRALETESHSTTLPLEKRMSLCHSDTRKIKSTIALKHYSTKKLTLKEIYTQYVRTTRAVQRTVGCRQHLVEVTALAEVEVSAAFNESIFQEINFAIRGSFIIEIGKLYYKTFIQIFSCSTS